MKHNYKVGDEVIYVHSYTSAPWVERAKITRVGKTYQVMAKHNVDGLQGRILEERLPVDSWMARDRLVPYSDEAWKDLTYLAAETIEANKAYQAKLTTFYDRVRQ